jgi:hypothetical protein
MKCVLLVEASYKTPPKDIITAALSIPRLAPPPAIPASASATDLCLDNDAVSFILIVSKGGTATEAQAKRESDLAVRREHGGGRFGILQPRLDLHYAEISKYVLTTFAARNPAHQVSLEHTHQKD